MRQESERGWQPSERPKPQESQQREPKLGPARLPEQRVSPQQEQREEPPVPRDEEAEQPPLLFSAG